MAMRIDGERVATPTYTAPKPATQPKSTASYDYMINATKPRDPYSSYDYMTKPASGGTGNIGTANLGSSNSSSGGKTASSSYGTGGGTSAPTAAPTPAPTPQAPPTPAPVTPPAPTTETVTIPDPMADATYKMQSAQLAQQMQDYRNAQQLAAAQYANGYNNNLRQLGWSGNAWNPNDTGFGTYGGAVDNSRNDFAGRNMLFSTSFADQLGNVDRTFNDRKTQLDNSKKDYTDTQNQQLTNYQNQNTQAKDNALRDAVSRISAQLGIGADKITPGKTGSFQRPVA